MSTGDTRPDVLAACQADVEVSWLTGEPADADARSPVASASVPAVNAPAPGPAKPPAAIVEPAEDNYGGASSSPLAASRPKLVRDKVPALIRSQGLEPVTRTAPAGEMPALLRDKLAEETREYLASGDPGELADVIEVVYALAGLHGLDAAGLEDLRAAKAAARGTFAGKAVWAGNREPGTGEEPS